MLTLSAVRSAWGGHEVRGYQVTRVLGWAPHTHTDSTAMMAAGLRDDGGTEMAHKSGLMNALMFLNICAVSSKYNGCLL